MNKHTPPSSYMSLIMDGTCNEAQQRIVECLLFQVDDHDLSKDDLEKVLENLKNQHKSIEDTLKDK